MEVRTTDIITESDFRKQIKDKPQKGYLFFGEEDYLKAYSLKSLRDRICPDPSLAPFNYIKLDGLDLTPGALLNAIETLPMMSDSKLIEVTGLNFREVKASLLDEYCKVLALLEEYDYNTVVISVAAECIDEGFLPKKPSTQLKKLGENLTLVHFARSTPLMLARWVNKHFLANGVTADAAVCSALVDYCGTDMFRLAAETDKISWYALANGRTYVEPEDIKKVALADTGYDSFAFTNAIMASNKAEALRVLGEMRRKRLEPTVVMGEMIKVVTDMLAVRIYADEGLTTADIAKKTKIHEYRVKLCLKTGTNLPRLKEILSLCAEADAALKLSPQGYAAIERLICAL